MKKIFLILVCTLLFTFSLGFGITAIAAGEESVKITLNSNFNTNTNNLFVVTVHGTSGNQIGRRYTENFTGSFPDASYVKLEIKEDVIPKSYEGKAYAVFKKVTCNGKDCSSDLEKIEITEDSQINIVFEFEKFEIFSDYKLSNGNNIPGTIDGDFVKFYTKEGSAKVEIVPDKDGKYFIEYGKTLVVEPVENISVDNGFASYVFDKLFIYLISNSFGETLTTKREFVIDNNFLELWFETVGFVLGYKQTCSVSLSFAGSDYQTDYNLYKVVNGEQVPVDKNDIFDKDTDLIITFQLKENYILSKNINGNYRVGGLDYSENSFDKVTQSETGLVSITFRLLRNKNFIIYAEKVPIIIDAGDINIGDGINLDYTSFKIGDVITMTADIGWFYSISKWTVGDVEVPEIGKTIDGMKRVSETKIELDTGVWYGIRGAKFDSSLNTNIKTAYLATIIAVPAAVLLFILLLIILVKKNKVAKKKVLELLQVEKKTGYTYNTGSMIVDLKNDNFNKVSNEDIKAQMKKKKK